MSAVAMMPAIVLILTACTSSELPTPKAQAFQPFASSFGGNVKNSNVTVADVTDPVATLTTPVGNVADDLAIHTATLGAHTFAVTGTDNTSNQTVVTHN